MSININDFINLYKSKEADKELEDLVEQHIVCDYVPYEQKADVAKAIVDTCFWRNVKDASGEEHKELYIDSVSKYMLTCMAIVDLYTDIIRQKGDGKMLEDFNMLNKYGVIDSIVRCIDERELNEFNMIVQMTCDDTIANEYENHAFISKQVNRFGELIRATLLPIVSQLDTDKIEELIKQYQR